ncbi:MAG TPA: zinc ribbon domain-containing protein [Cytophagaceae bacterium]|jgi:hypothetical protein|nr:zinc ribbon domain-containing protein [Cytophagaceae bacterium]
MKHCTNCGAQLSEDDNFCPDCGSDQNKKQATGTSGVVLTLCILTILGSGLGIARGFFYQSIAGIADNTDYWRGYAFAIVNVGTIIGAIFMLTGRLSGFKIYLIFQIAYILLVLFTTFIYTPGGSSDVESAIGIFGIFVASLFIIPSMILLIFFIAMVPKHLK